MSWKGGGGGKTKPGQQRRVARSVMKPLLGCSKAKLIPSGVFGRPFERRERGEKKSITAALISCNCRSRGYSLARSLPQRESPAPNYPGEADSLKKRHTNSLLGMGRIPQYRIRDLHWILAIFLGSLVIRKQVRSLPCIPVVGSGSRESESARHQVSLVCESCVLRWCCMQKCPRRIPKKF